MSAWWLLLPAALAGYLYSLTFTRFGRIELVPALLCRAASLASRVSGPIAYSESDRASANKNARQMMTLANTGELDVDDLTIDTPAGALPLRIYRPAGGRELPVILNIHGGAWWMGNDYIDDGIMRHLSGLAGALIVSVDYRLAPEHPYPAALDDCLAALEWTREHAADYGGDPERLIFYGTSAGGGLAASLCLLCAQRGLAMPRAQVLIVPVTDLSGEHWGDSMRDLDPGYILTASDLADMVANFVPNVVQRKQPLVSPVYAERLEGLPPAFVATAQFDPLRDQGEYYAGLLERAGLEVERHCYQRVIHGFLGSKAVMVKCNEAVAGFIARHS